MKLDGKTKLSVNIRGTQRVISAGDLIEEAVAQVPDPTVPKFAALRLLKIGGVLSLQTLANNTGLEFLETPVEVGNSVRILNGLPQPYASGLVRFGVFQLVGAPETTDPAKTRFEDKYPDFDNMYLTFRNSSNQEVAIPDNSYIYMYLVANF